MNKTKTFGVEQAVDERRQQDHQFIEHVNRDLNKKVGDKLVELITPGKLYSVRIREGNYVDYSKGSELLDYRTVYYKEFDLQEVETMNIKFASLPPTPNRALVRSALAELKYRIMQKLKFWK